MMSRISSLVTCPTPCIPLPSPPQPTPDPTANLTFNLTLTEREKGDRAKAPLPYVKSERQKTQLLSTAGSGKIFYTPDEADDFDDSDPDDDLDI